MQCAVDMSGDGNVWNVDTYLGYGALSESVCLIGRPMGVAHSVGAHTSAAV